MISAIAIFQLLLTPFLLESPRWLLMKNQNSSKARFIIKKLRGFRYDEEVETEVEHFVRSGLRVIVWLRHFIPDYRTFSISWVHRRRKLWMPAMRAIAANIKRRRALSARCLPIRR